MTFFPLQDPVGESQARILVADPDEIDRTLPT